MPAAAAVLLETLRRAGVARLFAAPGSAGPELREAARAGAIDVIDCAGAAAAIAIAAVTGELTGRPGVALAAAVDASAAAALDQAMRDHAPLILVTGPPATGAPPDGALPLKGSETIGADSAAHWAAHAVHLALGEPRGPVRLVLPPGVHGRDALALAVSVTPPAPVRPDDGALDAAAELLRRADRPLVVAGHGCRAADAKWLRALVEALPAPVLTTRRAKGAVPDPHVLAMGLLAGDALDAPLLARADLIVAVGLEAGEPAPPFAVPVLSLARHGAGVGATVEVAGEPGAIIEELAPRLAGRAAADWDIAWLDGVRRARRAAAAPAGPGLAAHRVVRIARELSPEGAISAMDGVAGLAGWDAVEPGECLVASLPAAPAFALRAAIAAQLVHRDRRVVCVTDGAGLDVGGDDLSLLARLGLPVIAVALDAAAPARMAATRAAGARAWLARDEAELRGALIAAGASGGPAVIAVAAEVRGETPGGGL